MAANLHSQLHSIVVPVYNERDGLEPLYQRMSGLLSQWERRYQARFEVILVNDGSKDGSDLLLNQLHQKDPRFKVLHLSRNFGHQIAISAGMEWAQGTTVTVMDADLQDPPEVIEKMLEKWNEGFEVVFAVRNKREGETAFKLWTASIFYRLIRRITHFDIPVDTGDFRLMDRKVVNAFLQISERHRFIRGLVSWVGFKQVGVNYDRASRVHGQTHFPFKKMLKFALDGITSFSMFPLQIATYVGASTAAASFLGILWIIYLRLFTQSTIQGWSSLMVVILFLGSIQLIALGMIGEYLGRTYDEVKRRPLYFVGEAKGFERPLIEGSLNKTPLPNKNLDPTVRA